MPPRTPQFCLHHGAEGRCRSQCARRGGRNPAPRLNPALQRGRECAGVVRGSLPGTQRLTERVRRARRLASLPSVVLRTVSRRRAHRHHPRQRPVTHRLSRRARSLTGAPFHGSGFGRDGRATLHWLGDSFIGQRLLEKIGVTSAAPTSGGASERALGDAVFGVGTRAVEALDSPHAQLAELRLREPEVSVEVVELLLEARETIEMLVWGISAHARNGTPAVGGNTAPDERVCASSGARLTSEPDLRGCPPNFEDRSLCETPPGRERGLYGRERRFRGFRRDFDR